jgi:hypothetical protein
MLNEEIMQLLAFDLGTQSRGKDDHAPPSVEARQGVLDLLLARCFPEGAASEGQPASPARERATEDATADDATAEHEPPIAIQASPAGRRSHRRTWVALGSGALAMAAAAALVWVVQPPPETPWVVMPGFDQDWGPGYAGSQRSGSPVELPRGCDVQLHRDGDLTVRFRPQEQSRDELAVAALARQDEGEPRWLALDPEVGTEGVITLDQSVAELGLVPGRWTLTFFIVRQREPPEPAALVDAEPGRHPGYTAIRNTVCVAG